MQKFKQDNQEQLKKPRRFIPLSAVALLDKPTRIDIILIKWTRI